MGFSISYVPTIGGIMTTAEATINDKREIFGWAMYDWANSAFSTTVGTVFLAPYVANLAADAAKADFLAKNGLAWDLLTLPPLLPRKSALAASAARFAT